MHGFVLVNGIKCIALHTIGDEFTEFWTWVFQFPLSVLIQLFNLKTFLHKYIGSKVTKGYFPSSERMIDNLSYVFTELSTMVNSIFFHWTSNLAGNLDESFKKLNVSQTSCHLDKKKNRSYIKLLSDHFRKLSLWLMTI